MATNVSMQTPISDYGNFGDSISDNFTQTWNAANERALKLKITEDALDEQHYQFNETMEFNKGLAIGKIDGIETLNERALAMQEFEHEYMLEERAEMNRIAEHKDDIFAQKEALQKEYQAAISGGGKYDKNFGEKVGEFFFGGLGYDADWSFEEWLADTGQSLPDYSDYEGDLTTTQTVPYKRTQMPFELTTGGSDTELMNSLNLLNLTNPQYINPYQGQGG